VSRRIIRKTYLKPDIIKHFQQQTSIKLTLDHSKFQTESDSEVHLVEQQDTDEDLMKYRWKKSNTDISLLRRYIVDKFHDELKESEFLDVSSQLVLFSDSAGSGKSYFLHNLTLLLRERFRDHWIVGVDLKTFEKVCWFDC
jgi:hypothetical protein